VEGVPDKDKFQQIIDASHLNHVVLNDELSTDTKTVFSIPSD